MRYLFFVCEHFLKLAPRLVVHTVSLLLPVVFRSPLGVLMEDATCEVNQLIALV